MSKPEHRSISRRGWLTAAGAALAATASGELSGAGEPRGVVSAPKAVRLGMVVDLDRCVGCKACAVACKSENGVRLGGFRSWVSEVEVGSYPRVTRAFLPQLCNHCKQPACLKVCPVGATFQRQDGIVDVDKTRCIGCRYCMVACPYGARYFNPRSDPEEEAIFPSRRRGTVDKCNFCLHRVDNGFVPSCVNTCPAGARFFGDLNDSESEVAEMVNDGQVKTLLPEFQTGPSVFYRGGDPEQFNTGGSKT